EKLTRFDGDLNADAIVDDVDLIEVLTYFGPQGFLVQVGSPGELPQPPEIGQDDFPVLNVDEGMWYAMTVPDQIPIDPSGPDPLRPLGPTILPPPEIGEIPPIWWDNPLPLPDNRGACCTSSGCMHKTMSDCWAISGA